MTVLKFVDIHWSVFCDWIQGKTIKATTYLDEGRVWLTFTDGTEAIVASNYDAGYSPETPGDGVELPTVAVWGEDSCEGCGELMNLSAAGRESRTSNMPIRVACLKCGKGRWVTADKP